MRAAIVATLWVASLLVAGWVGSVLAGPDGDPSPGATADSGPVMRDGNEVPQLTGRPARVPDRPDATSDDATPLSPDATDVSSRTVSTDDASLLLLADLRELVLRGDPAAVLRRISHAGVEGNFLYEADDRKEQALRLLWLGHLVENRVAVLELLESLLLAEATNPGALASVEDGVSMGSVQAFDDFLFALPLLASEAQVARFRQHVEGIRTDWEGMPEDYECWEAESCLVAWANFLTPEEALRRLETGEPDAREMLVLLARLTDDQRGSLDPVPILRRIVAEGRWGRQFTTALRLVPPRSGDLPELDAALFQKGLGPPPRDLGVYLAATGRGAWPAGQAFVEGALETYPRAISRLVESLVHLSLCPPAPYVRALLADYEVEINDSTRRRLRQVYDLD